MFVHLPQGRPITKENALPSAHNILVYYTNNGAIPLFQKQTMHIKPINGLHN